MISWIIIGRNWNKHLNKLTDAIKYQTADKNKYEIIIVDDNSVDQSINKLEAFCVKNSFVLIKNQSILGRGASRNRGMQVATNPWCLFSNNNTYPEPNLIQSYLNKINNDIDVIAGSIKYECKDDITFEKYLNSTNRGVNKYSQSDNIPFQLVLFGNCVIKKNLLAATEGFNEKIVEYGGEELELMWRITNKNPDIKIIKNNTYVIRKNHPSFVAHCNRMVEFGNNLNKNLPIELIQLIIPNLLNRFKWWIPTALGLQVLKCLYKTIPVFQFKIIRLALGMAVLRGIKNE